MTMTQMARNPRKLFLRAARMLWVPALAAGLALPAAAQVDKTFAVAVRPVVTVSNPHGRIEVKSWKQAQVRVAAQHGSRVEVDADQVGNRIEIVTHALAEGLPAAELMTVYTVTVPEETELHVRTDSGSVVVERVFGDMTFETVAADVELREVAGYLLIKTVGGTLKCIRCAGRIEFTSISGSAEMIQPVSSNVRLFTNSGTIYFDGEFVRGGVYVLKTYSGPIEVRFSENDSFNLTATSVNGEVSSEASLRPPAHSRSGVRPRGPAASLLGTYNEGYAKVELTSFLGRISIRKRN
jgi:DUF4097 and DUF4098 domain-containing protein YvlB